MSPVRRDHLALVRRAVRAHAAQVGSADLGVDVETLAKQTDPHALRDPVSGGWVDGGLEASRRQVERFVKRFDPHQPRDPDGQWSDGVPGPSSRDALKLAGKINLGPGETLVSSGKVDGDAGGIRMALTDQNGKRMLRFGAGGEMYGQRNRDAGTTAWDGNPSSAALSDAERKRLEAEFDALGDEYDTATPARREAIDRRQDDINELLGGGDGEFNGTAKIDEYSWRRLSDRIRPAMAEAAEQAKAEADAYEELEKIRLDGSTDTVRIAELERIARANDTNGITFTSGIIAGSEWGDVHYSVELHETEPYLSLGVTPKGAPEDWGDSRDWLGTFTPAETRKFLRLLDKVTAPA